MSIPEAVYHKLSTRTPYSLGWSKRCLDFDGLQNYVQIADDPSLCPVRVSAFAWIKVADAIPFTGTRGIFGKGPGADRQYWLYGVNADDELRANIETATAPYSWSTVGADLEADLWYYVGLTYDGAFGRTWVNGVVRGSIPANGNLITPAGVNDLLIGNLPGTALFWLGLIDGYVEYSRALTQNEILYNMLNYNNPIGNGLICWIRMEEGSGVLASDESGNGNNGTLLPAPSPPVWVRTEKWELRSGVTL